MLLFKNSSCMDVKRYIKEHYYDIDKHKTIAHICKHTRLKAETVKGLYAEIEIEKLLELRDKKQEKREIEIRYKGRERDFFRFDTSKLWREIV